MINQLNHRKRNQGNINQKKSNKENIEEIFCKKCNHNRAWTSRNSENPQYNLKCCKCGNILK